MRKHTLVILILFSAFMFGQNDYKAITIFLNDGDTSHPKVVYHNYRSVIQYENLFFITEQPSDIVQELKEEMESDLVVIDGGKLITSLINTQLLDGLTIYTIPVMLGEGIPFIGRTIGSEWKSINHYKLNCGSLQTTYRFESELIQ